MTLDDAPRRGQAQYDGWDNPETRAFNLNWQNDEPIYRAVVAEGQRYLTEELSNLVGVDEDDRDSVAYQMGDHTIRHVRDLLTEWLDETPAGRITPTTHTRAWLIWSEVGSWWRINPTQTGYAVLEAVDAEANE